MTVAHTSRQAYQHFSLKLSKDQTVIFNFLKENPGCDDRYISDKTKLKINNVTGRRNELLKKGVIEYIGTGVSITGIKTKRYKVKEEYL